MVKPTGDYSPPKAFKSAFNCASCGAYAQQTWYGLGAAKIPDDADLDPRVRDALATAIPRKLVPNHFGSECAHCRVMAIWWKDDVIWPRIGVAPRPNQDMPPDSRRNYEEANSIVNDSPRAAAALLRLAIEELCVRLGAKGRTLNDRIGYLVNEGLSPRIQRALDVVRVTGNQAIHPGHIDMQDDVSTALSIFPLVNLITEEMISRPNRVNKLYEEVPTAIRASIEKRDKKNGGKK